MNRSAPVYQTVPVREGIVRINSAAILLSPERVRATASVGLDLARSDRTPASNQVVQKNCEGHDQQKVNQGLSDPSEVAEAYMESDGRISVLTDEGQRHTGWNIAKARREVKKAIKSYGWNPIDHAGYQRLRQQIMDGELLDKDLT